MSARIPTLDITRFDTDRDAFVAELGAAYRQWGFAGIRNHGIAQTEIDAAYDVFKAFFALPEEVKRRYHVPGSGGARGYTAFGVETAKDSKHFDLKEFWHIGREIPDDSPYREVMAPNLWPEEVPGFRERGYQLYQQLDQLGSRVLAALALHIGLPQDYFVDKTNNGNSILRPIHYPPITSDDIPNVRAGAHGDINFITLLVGASAAGLEVRSNDGEWVPFTADADTIVVNIGDMLQRLTNHVYPSTIHRVVNPPGEAARKPRYSVPFFLHPNPDFLIDVLPSCISADNPSRYLEPITAHGFLEERLREIKLK
ncbi:2-oxoglutarate and iron-dependent oxygenase domain-containing protein [Xanthomonas nasturtii]|uniref:isopenicillin N synthase family dioxygenase n=1 Tax=Xanthomonas TaxID=338 RepID=UPI0006F78F02|nr:MULTISPECIES: 2-oxoglutarate and iron-dependent oxygenase domain-containing protein [Xanthomonas]KQR13755.1 flavonol synthase [Xanthomonas sp. Leaf148]MEA9555039.1 2-oxoglutarate and iron-dependent oxygenase domain-containing protein [Xanthomonas nasturtii]MEA9580073.1 2-oxoglutarate and iron-dependent oxygenase domain-containing protein [Xanthomonas nasturtii]MEA9586464.1 2-oxoglutarate and iron-dependent oxygenase domain-containing protein [Xanthomonas sp. WHRI 10064B]MEA9614892.1 2-oxogl